MKRYRDQAGAHGDRLPRYLAAKRELFREQHVIIEALGAFYCLSSCLLKRQAKEMPDLVSDIEDVLFEQDLRLGQSETLNRRWLREMGLLQSGSFKKSFS